MTETLTLETNELPAAPATQAHASLARGGLAPQPPSFPRKRESSTAGPSWIPAYAGMTEWLSGRLARLLETSLIWLALLGAWFLAAEYTPLGDNPLIPHPLVTARALWESLPELWVGTVSSFTILVPGFGLATLLGIVSGLAVGTSPRLQRAIFPFARVAAPVPPTVYIPYAIAVLPTFRLSAIFVVFVGAFWPIFQNAAAGAHALEERYRDNARILGLSGVEYHWRVVFPAALPHIFSGMAVGLGFSFILLTVAELFGANAGLGRFVQYYADFADYPKMVAGILYTGLVTFLAMTGLDALKRRALFWQR